jgi:hypothetical protein
VSIIRQAPESATTKPVAAALRRCHCCEKPFNKTRKPIALCCFFARDCTIACGFLCYECREDWFARGAYTMSIHDFDYYLEGKKGLFPS